MLSPSVIRQFKWITLSNKTLIILIPGFPANEDDSTCLPFPQAFVRNLKFLNPFLNIKVMAFQYPFFKSVYEWHGVEVRSFNGRNRGGIQRLILWANIRRHLKKIFAEEEVLGILSFWMGEAALIAKYASEKYGVRSFTWLMGQDAKKSNRYVLFTRLRQRSLIALSDFLADEYYKNYKIKPAHTIPPGVDVSSFPVQIKERAVDILGVGSLITLKQFEQLIILVARLAVSRPEIRAVICGEGPERGRLEQIIHDFHLGDQIKLCGELDHASILSLMQESKILVHPSSYEGFSTVCAEALYAGARVVSYCQPMHFNFKHHYIVKSPEEMQIKVMELLDGKTVHYDRVLTYAIEETCNKILSLYN
jgi:glycosyltransferase involved in cell wall biosynthesis